MNARKRAPKSGTISAQDWIDASRAVLIKRGISAVKVEPLAKKLGVTPGSFYWHFKNRDALYRALLKDWLATNVHPFIEALEEAAECPKAQYLALAYVWVLSPQFDAPLDVAIREWGKTSKLAARTMKYVDHKRISLYQWVFEGFGHDPMSAIVRARTMYFHQIGYYAMRVDEDPDKRLLQIPHYAEIIAGDTWLRDLETPEAIEAALVEFPRRESLADRIARRRHAGVS
ncbi:TetR/AcrR family transcriptional regulator [Roseovarius rhodophyticola]|uniref:TetR/AcrR family transcriptional regulator n=1 Tax=Roseovarius rhodophyticola TaxID=3080827 RepID=A0ABZ2TK52_9RHOB|nr:TetR/AcrR family transcriptional regulator [Roseovarius sp. W115]MDV2927942.1 TetR/AcrR family transcriptional regulator [Roseovarius sp. W115]